MAKLLITGSSDFIGSFLVQKALEQGHEIHAGVRKISSRRYLQDPRIHFAEINLKDQNALQAVLEKQQFDAIIHNAGAVAVDRREDYFNVNTELTRNLAKAYQNIFPNGRFVFMSSLAANGPAHQQSNGVLNSSSEHLPVTAYGESKLAADQLLERETTLDYVS